MDGRVMVMLAVLLLGGVALFGMLDTSGGTDGEAAVAAAVSATRGVSPLAGDADPGRPDPAGFVSERGGVTVASGRIAATEHLSPVWIEDVVAGYNAPLATVAAGAVGAAAIAADCTFTSPAAGSRVANVAAGAPQKRVRLTLPGGGGRGAASDRRVMEVAVTETEFPVHLVLQAGDEPILWNLSLAPRARLSGVSLLGGTAQAVANLPAGVPVEAMDTAALAACGVEPAQPPRPGAAIFGQVDAGAVAEADARAELTARQARVEAWNGWFAGQFGVRSDDTRIGYDRGAVAAVVGPLPTTPEARAQHRALDGASVILVGKVQAAAADIFGQLLVAGE